jgi:ABC-2 type transport system ATP-binding protein
MHSKPITQNAIEVADLRKSYRASGGSGGSSSRANTVTAVRDVSFSMERGEIVALLGPNGAGKTTTLEILEGFRHRDGGTVRVLGMDPADRSAARELRERTGLVLQDIAVESYLTVRETIARQAGYYAAPRRVPEVIDLVGLDGLERRKVKGLSGGQKRRLDLALGLIGRPELLYLDEPTTGFDPSARHDAWDLVRDLRQTGTTILLTTHDMAEAEALADRVIVLADGVIVAQGQTATLGGQDAERARITFRLPADLTACDLPVAGSAVDGEFVIETSSPTEDLHQLTGWALRRSITLAGLTVDRPSLEDVYLRLTREGALAGVQE